MVAAPATSSGVEDAAAGEELPTEDAVTGDELRCGPWTGEDAAAGDEVRVPCGAWTGEDAGAGDDASKPSSWYLVGRYHPILARYQDLIPRKYHALRGIRSIWYQVLISRWYQAILVRRESAGRRGSSADEADANSADAAAADELRHGGRGPPATSSSMKDTAANDELRRGGRGELRRGAWSHGRWRILRGDRDGAGDEIRRGVWTAEDPTW
uniref:Uncharacterized protein n=1 Tax=Oryza meridionalis TaxID=40149 RepID=A0A0E0D188_9ORYZ